LEFSKSFSKKSITNKPHEVDFFKIVF